MSSLDMTPRSLYLPLFAACALVSAFGCGKPSQGVCNLLLPDDVAPIVGGSPMRSDDGPTCGWAGGGRWFGITLLGANRRAVDGGSAYDYLRRQYGAQDEPTVADTACSYWSKKAFRIMVLDQGQLVMFAVKRNGNEMQRDSIAYRERLRDEVRPLAKKALSALRQRGPASTK